LGHDGGNSRDDDASVLIIVFVSLTVVLVVFGIVMLKCFTMKRTKSAAVHLKKESDPERSLPSTIFSLIMAWNFVKAFGVLILVRDWWYLLFNFLNRQFPA
jgi:hypothetical protein